MREVSFLFLRGVLVFISHNRSPILQTVLLQIRGAMLPEELIKPKSYSAANFQLDTMARLALQV